jgi:hypothetical protein
MTYFSHPWKKKPVLRHAKRYLNAVGFKVWYDEDDMQWDLIKSMRDGVAKSKVVLACIIKDYEICKIACLNCEKHVNWREQTHYHAGNRCEPFFLGWH